MNLLEKTISSVEVAEMVGKDHSKLLRDIRTYIEQLGQSNLGQSDFFTESTYTNLQNKEMPCYKVTKKGCEFIAHKLTGVKGTDFTARYINKFHEMEEVIANPGYSNLPPEMQMFQLLFDAQAKQYLETQEGLQKVNQRMDDVQEIMLLDSTSWRDEVNHLMKKISIALGGGHQTFSEVRSESYALFEKRFCCNLKQRLTNKRRRMAEEGICKSKRDKLCYLDIIQEEKKLIEGYIAIVKEMSFKYIG